MSNCVIEKNSRSIGICVLCDDTRARGMTVDDFYISIHAHEPVDIIILFSETGLRHRYILMRRSRGAPRVPSVLVAV